MRRDGADSESTNPAVQAGRIGEPDPQFQGFGILAHDGCVLIKLLMRLLHCRKA
jgi:hypothetical protein